MLGQNNPTIKKWLNSKLTLFFGILILLFIGVNFLRSWAKSQEINQEIKKMQTEISTLEKNNLELAELINYLNSTAYLEEKAREDLGLKKEGEKIVIVSETGQKTDGSLNGLTQAQTGNNLSNLGQWWQYFFANKYE